MLQGAEAGTAGAVPGPALQAVPNKGLPMYSQRRWGSLKVFKQGDKLIYLNLVNNALEVL